jgi:hypothetical protein
VSAPKLTPWFPGHIKPVRPGVYEVRFSAMGGFAYWDGSLWGWAQITCAQARRRRDSHGASQQKSWRGLAKEPK